MKTYNLSINNIPNSDELRELLGVDFYECYKELCKVIETLLKPDIEKWDDGGRRGKYYHGYVTENFLIDLYLIKNGLIKCEFVIPRILFKRIYNKKVIFQSSVLNSIETCKNYSDEFGGAIYLSIIIDSSTAEDTIKIIDLLSNNSNPPR